MASYTDPVVLFVFIEVACALVLASLFLAVMNGSPCRGQYAGIGAILGLSLGPFIYAASTMYEIDQDLKNMK